MQGRRLGRVQMEGTTPATVTGPIEYKAAMPLRLRLFAAPCPSLPLPAQLPASYLICMGTDGAAVLVLGRVCCEAVQQSPGPCLGSSASWGPEWTQLTATTRAHALTKQPAVRVPDNQHNVTQPLASAVVHRQKGTLVHLGPVSMPEAWPIACRDDCQGGIWARCRGAQGPCRRRHTEGWLVRGFGALKPCSKAQQQQPRQSRSWP